MAHKPAAPAKTVLRVILKLMTAPVPSPVVSRFAFGMKSLQVVALLLVLVAVAGCGRKPGAVDEPEGRITHTYPPVTP